MPPRRKFKRRRATPSTFSRSLARTRRVRGRIVTGVRRWRSRARRTIARRRLLRTNRRAWSSRAPVGRAALIRLFTQIGLKLAKRS